MARTRGPFRSTWGSRGRENGGPNRGRGDRGGAGAGGSDRGSGEGTRSGRGHARSHGRGRGGQAPGVPPPFNPHGGMLPIGQPPPVPEHLNTAESHAMWIDQHNNRAVIEAIRDALPVVNNDQVLQYWQANYAGRPRPWNPASRFPSYRNSGSMSDIVAHARRDIANLNLYGSDLKSHPKKRARKTSDPTCADPSDKKPRWDGDEDDDGNADGGLGSRLKVPKNLGGSGGGHSIATA